VGEHAIRELMHRNMVPQDACGDSRPHLSSPVQRSQARPQVMLAFW
jgi:hypothetical protein